MPLQAFRQVPVLDPDPSWKSNLLEVAREKLRDPLDSQKTVSGTQVYQWSGEHLINSEAELIKQEKAERRDIMKYEKH